MTKISQDLINAVNDLIARRFEPILKAQSDEIRRLRSDLSMQQDLVLYLKDKVAALEGILCQRTDEAVAAAEVVPALTEGDYIHHDLAARYQSIVEQQLVQLADEWLRRQASANPDRFVAEARLVADLCENLFGESEIDRDHLTYKYANGQAAAKIGRVCDMVAELRSQAAGVGWQLWDFTVESGKLPDPMRHAIWPGCSITSPIDFVIAPAYVVRDRILARQVVFTEKVRTDRKGFGDFLARLWPG